MIRETIRRLGTCRLFPRLSKLTGGGSRAGLTRLVPGFPHIVGTAAHLLGHVEGKLVLTRVVEVTVTHTLPHVCISKRRTIL